MMASLSVAWHKKVDARTGKVVRVPECSHWIVHERPDLVCSEIESFVSAKGR
jgi:pimeloyl-ACP methyl ester carboxylesterase